MIESGGYNTFLTFRANNQGQDIGLISVSFRTLHPGENDGYRDTAENHSRKDAQYLLSALSRQTGCDRAGNNWCAMDQGL